MPYQGHHRLHFTLQDFRATTHIVNLDVSSLCTNIDTNEGLKIVKEEVEKNSQLKPSAETITLSLEKVLRMNNFIFDDQNYLQTKGTAMGTRAAPDFANVYMGRVEENYTYESSWRDHIIDWARFIDDIFLLWNGDKRSLINFLDYLNNAIPTIKYTYERSETEIHFLDVTMRKDEGGNVSTDVYQKRTDTHPYLNHNSTHPSHLKKSIPNSQALRLGRICSSDETLKNRIEQYSEYFVACGYKRKDVRNEMYKVVALTQKECLNPTSRDNTSDRMPLVTTYNPYTS